MQEFFYIRTKNKFIQLRFSEVIYGEAQGNFVKLICINKCYMVSGGMKEVSAGLPKHLFCRVHRSYLVAIEKVKEIEKDRLMLNDGLMLPIGRFFVSELKERVRIVGRKYVQQRQVAHRLANK